MRTILLTGLALATIAGCNNSAPNDNPDSPVDPVDPTDPDDPPNPQETARDNDELATIIAAHLRAEFALQLTAAAIVRNEYALPEGFVITGDDGADAIGNGTFGGLSINFALHCNDGTDQHNRVPCNEYAHHGHIKLTIAGSQTMGVIAMNDMNRVVNWEIRDVNLGKARFRGPDGLVLKSAVTTNGEQANYTVMFDAIYEQVRFLPAATIPTFGTIDFTVNTQRDRGADHRVFDTIAHLNYGASGAPTTLTFDSSINYNVDLKTGDVIKQ
ncbi:MAG TPA: hypothetical protein VL326_17440 [Kofleriaceae bacterium]|jgi:hypothetical protein|nr:hypothetical protein [Kofleriaceae bacterium]